MVLIARPLSKGAGFLFVGWGFGSWGWVLFCGVGVWVLKTGSSILVYSQVFSGLQAGTWELGSGVPGSSVPVEMLPHSLSCSRILCLATWHFGTGFECTGFIGATLRCSIVLLYAPFYTVWQGGTWEPDSGVPGSSVPG